MYKKLEKQIRQEFEITYEPFEQKWVDYFQNTVPDAIDIKNVLFPHLRSGYLAHGSYGACSAILKEIQMNWVAIMEQDPNYFYYETLYPKLVRSIQALARFVKTDPLNLVLVKNVEFGIQSVLDMIKEGDTIAFLDFHYEAIVYAAKRVCEQRKASICVIETKVPITSGQILSKVEECFKNNKITLFVFEHISSPSAIVLPVKEIGNLARKYNVVTLVDGAHGVGQVDLALDDLQIDFYSSNFHKWMYSPRGCAFLYIHPSQYGKVHPPITTWGYKQGQLSEFIWQGTDDYTPYLCIPIAIELSKWLQPVFIQKKELTSWTATYFSQKFHFEILACDSTMVSVVLPFKECNDTCRRSDLHDDLFKLGIQIPVFMFKGMRCIRISIAYYNTRSDIEMLSEALSRCL